MKWKATVLAAALFCVLPTIGVSGQSKDIPVDIEVNNQYVKSDVGAYLQNGTTYVPVRFVGAALGADEITWNQASETATIKEGSTTIRVTKGDTHGVVNGKRVRLSGGVHHVNGRVFVPVRFIAENLGAKVSWDDLYHTVSIEKPGTTVPNELIDRSYTEDELLWLGRIIEAESTGESFTGKVAVGNVILNRVKDPIFPNTIYDVIFDKTYGVQFQPVANGTIYNTPSKDSIGAAKRALRGERPVGDSLYFLNPRLANNFWIPNNRPYFSTIGNHDFYL